MIDRDERRRLRHAVALYDREAEATPEHLTLGVERRAAGDEGPELPAEVTVDVAERPEALERVRASGCREFASQLFAATARGLAPLDVLAQTVEHARDCDDDGDALCPDRAGDLRRVERVLKVNLAAEHLRHEKPHELPEDVAERQEVEEANRVDDALPARILHDLLFERREVGEQVAVRQAHAARL